MIFEENNHYILWNVFIFIKNNTYMKKKKSLHFIEGSHICYVNCLIVNYSPTSDHHRRSIMKLFKV